MTTRRVEIERFSVVSSKPFQEILASLKSAVGHPDMAEFARATKSARTFAELENVVRNGLWRTGLMISWSSILAQFFARKPGSARRTPESRSWSMNGGTAYIPLMTGWRAF